MRREFFIARRIEHSVIAESRNEIGFCPNLTGLSTADLDVPDLNQMSGMPCARTFAGISSQPDLHHPFFWLLLRFGW
jgi:hypothetical protein